MGAHELIAQSVFGTLPSWILVAVTLAIAWRIARGGGGSAVSELAKANEVLDKRVHDLGGEVRDLRVENTELRSRTDFAAALVEHEHRALEAVRVIVSEHETRAVERHEATLHVLELIAKSLGPEPNDGGDT